MISMIVRLLALSGLLLGLWQVAIAGLSSLARLGFGSMAFAAAIGRARGDLWAEAARDAAGRDNATGANDRASRWATFALQAAPLRSDMWLQLAAGTPDARYNAAADHPTPLLMAYMVGSGKGFEWPERFNETVRSSALADDTMASFFRTDLALALKVRPDAADRVKAALTARDPALIAAVRQVDPTLVSK